MSGTMTRRATTSRIVVLLLVFVASITGVGSAHPTANENGFRDTFDARGALPGTTPSDPYEIKTGSWVVTEQPDAQGSVSTLTGPANNVLVQGSKASTPNEPMVFVRDLPFREMTAQVTAAFMDPLTPFGDLQPASSLGIVFRSPINDGQADRDNLYLFGAIVTGVAPGFPTGKAFALFKRVGRGYFIYSNKIVHTWADLTRPHEYKVVMGGGNILCYVDGRLVIEARDLAHGDQPTADDPLPGLPYDNGAVGLRTSSARAWFDDFIVVGNDAYEGRATASDVFVDMGSENSNVRRGNAVQLTNIAKLFGLPSGDTGYVYHDHGFDDAVVRTVDNPSGGEPSAGAKVGTASTPDGGVLSTVRLTHVVASATDPNKKVTVSIDAESIEATASAKCDGTSSSVHLTNATLTATIASQSAGQPDTVIGPIPLKAAYGPNTVLLERSTNGLTFSVVAHARTVTTHPRRIEVSALKLVIPFGSVLAVGGVTVPSVPNGRTPTIKEQVPPMEISIASVVAGRYCR